MSLKKPRIHIPKPCPASWQEMTPNASGKHCASCDKTVVDFTCMSDEEIKSFFMSKKEEKVCGHFLTSQVAPTYTNWQQHLIYAHAYVDRKFSFPLTRPAVLLVITAIMFLSGCASRTTGEPNIDGAPVDHSDNPDERRLLGDTVYIVPEDTLQKK